MVSRHSRGTEVARHALAALGLALVLLSTAATAREGAPHRTTRAADGGGARASGPESDDGAVLARLETVNALFNRLGHRSDLDQWGRADYWATPAELLARGAGDCEDLAVGKYFALRRMGVEDDRLAVTYAIDVELRMPHMVLLYRPADGSRALVLDSRHPRILPLDARPELVPVYGLNAAGVHVPGRARRGFERAPGQRHREWRRLLARHEGGGG